MPEYTKLKNAELEAMLKERGLPSGGKKADMVERLTKDDEQKKGGAEDEIDWDDEGDDAATAEPKKDTTAMDPVATAPAAGQTAEAAAKPTEDASKVSAESTANVKDDAVKSIHAAEPASEDKGGENGSAAKAAVPAHDFTLGVEATKLDEELKKRKARAERFGLKFEEDENAKKLQRAVKFGETGPPKGLDEALPERRKRAHDDRDENNRHKRRGGSKPQSRPGRGDTDGQRHTRDTANESAWNDADKARLDARKNRFASKTAS